MTGISNVADGARSLGLRVGPLATQSPWAFGIEATPAGPLR
ncbi:hypothetical protein ACVISU_005025 [Bradyrhizobium sp. USDA 4452]